MGHVLIDHGGAQGTHHVILATQGIEGSGPITAVERDEGGIAGGRRYGIRGHGAMLPVTGDGVPTEAFIVRRPGPRSDGQVDCGTRSISLRAAAFRP